jgi:uncharacterized protein (DUF1800 family)
VAVVTLTACGSGGSNSDEQTQLKAQSKSSSSPSITEKPTDRAQAARFLTQSTFGPSNTSVDTLMSNGYNAWFDQQFATPQSLHVPVVPKFNDFFTPQFVGQYPILSSFWTKAITAPDQLRQRTSFALSQIFVLSMLDMTVLNYPQGIASYMDMLGRNSFGNYRQLLEDVAMHPMMGIYLTHIGNQKEDPAIGRVPDENFAREILQLFSIGLIQLNPDGTPKLGANGQPLETYTNEDIAGLARVFTGFSWDLPNKDAASFDAFQGYFWSDENLKRTTAPMQPYPQFHSTSEKNFLGKKIPAGTSPQETLKMALDHIFNHSNVGPFVGKQLIQRLVTSNPSPAYISRVAAAFDNNGQGVRGDMKAVWRAVLLDPEARDPAKLQDPTFGKLREPILRMSAWARAFNVKSASGSYNVYFTDDPTSGVGQAPMRSPSVFNFYRPGYVPPNSATSARGLVAPEMQITGDVSVAAYVNLVQSMAQTGTAGFLWDLSTDYAAEKAIAGDIDKLVNRIDELLTYGSMSAKTRSIVRDAVASVPMESFDGPANRVRLAVMFTLASRDFIVQR